MAELERLKKSYRLQKKYLTMIDEIVAYQQALPENTIAGVEVNDRGIIEEAIENYHTQIFGEKVMSQVIPQITRELSNNLDVKFNRFFENLGQVTNALIMTENINKELLGILVQASGFDMGIVNEGRTETLEEVAFESEPLYQVIEQIILLKNNL